MKYVVVLSHLMSENCILSEESRLRADFCIDLFSSINADKIITLGWSYREDCDAAICDVMRDYILANSTISQKNIIAISDSRDTVGDVFFCRDYLKDKKIDELYVITSDYHVKRVTAIFNKLVGPILNFSIFGVETTRLKDKILIQKEKESLNAFKETFSGLDFSDLALIRERLFTSHKLYNRSASR